MPMAGLQIYAPERIITDAGHEVDLMINENERRIFGGEGLVGANLISHYILLRSAESGHY